MILNDNYMDKSDLILAQVPIVLSLILLTYQAYKTFEIRHLKYVFYGFLVNIFYLMFCLLFFLFKISEESIIVSTQIKSVLFFTSIIDMFSMLFFFQASISYLSKGKVKRIFLVFSYLIILLSTVARIVPDNPGKDLVPYIHMRYIPYSFIAAIIILMLASTLYGITKGYKGSKLLLGGTCLWALIQFIGIAEIDSFQKLFSDDRVEIVGFGIGFISKATILFGLFKYIITIGRENANNKEIASKLNLIFGVSFHEFSDPLRGLRTILHEINPEDESKAPTHIGFYRKSAEKIDEHYNHLLAIISASLKMYVSGTGKTLINEFYQNVQNEFEVTESINTTIQIVVLNLKSSLKIEDSEKIKFEYNMGGNCIVKYNPNQLYQVFQNLFKNSIEAFKGHQGIISIKTRIGYLSTDVEKQNKIIKIEIADNGPGIDKSISDKIFNLGFSSKSPTGRGLGLAIAQKLIEENSGSLNLNIPEDPNLIRIPAHFVIILPKAKTLN